MNVAIVGNVGSGKSVYIAKLIHENSKICFVNFDIKSKNAIRIKKEHIIKFKDKLKKEQEINWGFWNRCLKKYGEYHLFLDEIHNIVHARKSMSKWNVLMSIWISQIRKILGDKERTHIYLVSQRINRIDKAFRDLLHVVIYCKKYENKRKLIKTAVIEDGKKVYKMLPETWIMLYFFGGENCIMDYMRFKCDNIRTYKRRTAFVSNSYFQLYDSYVIFGDTAYL